MGLRYTGVMPLFEFACRDCGTRFEMLMRAGTAPVCPACRSEQVEKQLSVFAVGAVSSKTAPMPAGGPCGSCGHPDGPGACQYGN